MEWRVALLALLLVAGVAPTVPAAVTQRDPCAYEDKAEHIGELAIYQRGAGFESYIIFLNREYRMISTYGWFSTTINSRTIVEYRVINCKDFQFFTRVKAPQEVLVHVLPWIPIQNIAGSIYRRPGDPRDRYCIRFTATYTRTKEFCELFYGRDALQ